MNQVGNFFLFSFVFLFSLHSYAQCRSIRELVGVFDGDVELRDYAVDYQNSNSISVKGYDFTFQGQAYYFSNNDKLNFSSNQYCILTTNVACFGTIKSEVAKEQGAKVSSKSILSFNDFEIEQYRHLSRDLIFEFHKNTSIGRYVVLVMTASTATLIDNSITTAEKKKKNENFIREKLLEIRSSLSNGNYKVAESSLSSVKKISKENNLDQLFLSDFTSIEKQISSGKYNNFKITYDNYLSSNNFIKANDLLKQFVASSDNNTVKDAQQLQVDLTRNAVDYYGAKIAQRKLSRNYTEAILYSDSLLIFDPNNKRVKSDKLEMVSINSFLLERKSKVYDYWELNREAKNNMIKDYKELSLSSITKKAGNLSFDILINSDTSCNLTYNLSWKSVPSSKIILSETEKNKYDLKPYQKFGICGKSEGKISFDLSWTSTNYSVKFIDKSFRGASSNSTINNFIAKTYPQTNGRFKYTENIVNLNDEKINNIQLTGFHTRGPQNAIFSLILPGTGSLIVSYGKKGFLPMALFGAGIASVFLTNDSLINLAGLTGIATAYIWDLTSTLVIGSRNMSRSKTVRKSLRSGPILM
jgi:hypothetical protein